MRRSRRTTPRITFRRGTVYRDAEVGIVTDDGKGEFVGHRFADETSTGVKKLLHGTSSFGFDAGGGQHCGTAGTGRKTGYIEHILDGKRQSRKGTALSVRNIAIRIRHECSRVFACPLRHNNFLKSTGNAKNTGLRPKSIQ